VSLIEGFWAGATRYHRRLFLNEANGRTSGGVTFEFDMFDVTLDFDEAVATVADALGDKQSETAPRRLRSARRLVRRQTRPPATGSRKCSGGRPATPSTAPERAPGI
jgi:hypothetical protein